MNTRTGPPAAYGGTSGHTHNDFLSIGSRTGPACNPKGSAGASKYPATRTQSE